MLRGVSCAGMGTFLSEVYVRHAKPHAVQALCGASTEATGTGWVRVTSPSLEQNEQQLMGLVQHLSGSLSTTAVAVMVHDSDVFRAWLSEGGAMAGDIDSWPGWPDDEPAPRASGLDRWAAAGSLSVAELRQRLNTERTFAEEYWNDLALALGIVDAPATGDIVGPGLDDLGLPDGMKEHFDRMSQGAENASQADIDFVEAATQGDLAALRRAVEAGQDPNAVAPWKPVEARGGLMARAVPDIAVSAIYAAAMSDQAAAIELLCELGADPELSIPHGDIPLAAAAAAGKINAVEALLDEGVHPNEARPDGQTPLSVLRATRAQLAPMRAMLGGLPIKLPGMPELPSEADLQRCEDALLEAIADLEDDA